MLHLHKSYFDIVLSVQVILVMCGILTMVSIVNYWLILPMVVMGFLFYKVRGVYVATAQDIKRIEGISKCLFSLNNLICISYS